MANVQFLGSPEPDTFNSLRENLRGAGDFYLQKKLLEEQRKKELQDAIKKSVIEAQLKGKTIKSGVPIMNGEDLNPDALEIDPLYDLEQEGKIADSEMKIYQAGGPAPSRLGRRNQVQPKGPATVLGGGAAPVASPMSVLGGGQADDPAQYIADTLDEFGRPKGFKLKGQTDTEKKREIETSDLDKSLENMVSLFGEARDELATIPDMGESGLKGHWAGMKGKVKANMGNSPTANTYNAKRKAFATVMAKAAGEQRPTDEDVRRFMDTLPDTGLSDAENETRIRELIDDVKIRGAKAVWAARTGKQVQGPTFTGGKQAGSSAKQYVRTGVDEETGKRVGMLPDGSIEEIP